MLAPLTNTPRYAAWGSTTAIAELLGTEPSGGPEAELWFGAHPGSPALFVDVEASGGHESLAQWVDSRSTQDATGSSGWLPFLLKVLAAAKPLSLQAHPTAEQARAGFERENAAGIPLDAPERNYRDPHPKPELIVAVSERFEALAGFRPEAESRAIFTELGAVDAAARLDDLGGFVAWLLTRGEGVDELIDRVCAHEFDNADALRLVRSLADDYPGDPGIVLALTLNHVTLRRGEALYVPAGTIHAYVEGLGIELMTASDNVMRGGLTVKNVDVAELLAVLDARSGPPPMLLPQPKGPAHVVYHAAGTAPRLDWVTGESTVELSGDAIALCTEGDFVLEGQHGNASLSRGGALLVTADELPLRVTGSGSLFVASAVPTD